MSGVGISFGNTSAHVAVFREGTSEVIANSAGDRSTHTIVANQDSEILTGSPAFQMSSRQPQSVVRHLKSLLGKRLEEVPGTGQTCRLEEHNGEIIVNFSNTLRKSVSSLVKNVFDNLKETADSVLGEGNHNTVLAVPLDSSQQYKDIITKCAAAAGFNVIDTIPEPMAAVLSHDFEVAPENGHTIVFRVGGGTSSATLVKTSSGLYSVVDHVEEKLGGCLFDESIGRFLCSDFNKKYRCVVEDNARSYSKVLNASTQAKHNLSTVNTTECAVESVHDGKDLCVNLSRPRFETLIQSDLGKIMGILQGLTAKHSSVVINRVIMGGNSCKVFKLQSLVSNLLSSAKVITQAPGETASLGAANHLGIISLHPSITTKSEIENDGTVVIQTAPSNIDVRVGDILTPLISKDTPLPCTREIVLPEGEDMRLEADGKCLARAVLPGADDGTRVSLHVELLEDCGIEAVIKDCNTNERTSIHIPPPVGA